VSAGYVSAGHVVETGPIVGRVTHDDFLVIIEIDDSNDALDNVGVVIDISRFQTDLLIS